MMTTEQKKLVHELTAIVVRHNAAMTSLGHEASRFCTAGCARCCAMIFFVSPAEVEVIAAHLLDDPALMQGFLARSAEREALRAPHVALWERCQNARMGDDPALAAWYRLDIRCAFVRDGLCSIYPVRPLACSLYNSIVPAATCAVEPKSYESETMRAQHSATRHLLAHLAAAHLPGGPARLDVSWLVRQRLAAEGL